MSRIDKFREMILYVARETEDDPKCGATKLNKVLFYADFLAYRELGSAISDQTYQRLDYGPAPKGIVPAIEAMQQQGECAWAKRNYHGHQLRKLLPLREPNLEPFTGQEIALIHRIIDQLVELNASQVSELSHQFAGWQAAAPGEDIPFETVFVGQPADLAEEDVSWALEIIEEHESDVCST